VTVAGATAACVCGWTAGPLRASREGPSLTGAQRAEQSAAAHLRRISRVGRI